MFQSRYFPTAHGEEPTPEPISTAGHGRPTSEPVDLSWRDCGPWTTHNGPDFFPEGMQPVGRAHAGAEEHCQEEGEAERSLCGVTTNLHSLSPLAPLRVGSGV